MFEIGWSELLVIGVVALIAIGPKELPGVLRTVGLWMGKVRRMAAEFQGQFQEAMREAELSDLKKQVDEMSSVAQSVTNFDPMESVRKEVESVHDDLAALGETPAAPTPPAEPAATAAVTAATDAPPPAALPEPATATPGEPAPPVKPASGER